MENINNGKMKHTIVVGLAFGDESKGATVDHLCATQDVAAVVRFSGGPQTLHHVVLPDGRVHGFSQFGSGTLRGVPTIHTRFSLINPFNLAREAQHLVEEFGIEDPFQDIYFDANCLLITPVHRAVNQAQEIARGADRHGSCGQGIGVAQQYALDYPDDAPRMADINGLTFGDDESLLRNLTLLFERLVTDEVRELLAVQTPEELFDMYRQFEVDFMPMIGSTDLINGVIKGYAKIGPLVFEGTQGVLLDEWHGFHPHTTWSTTTFANAEVVLREVGFERDDWSRLGLTRAYTTRHGAGPLPGEDPELLEAFPEKHNGTGTYQGSWRVAPLDIQLLEYAVDVCGGIDQIGVSHLDVIPKHANTDTGSGTPVTLWHDYAGERYPVKSADQLEDLSMQEALTARLKNLGPTDFRYTTMNMDRDTVILTLEDRLHAPVTLTATGPTSEDRVYTMAETMV